MVKKRVLALSLVLVMLLGTVAQATGPMRAPRAVPKLSFTGTTATCLATAYGNARTDRVSMTMKLWNGGVCLKTWTGSGTYRVSLNKPTTVSSGKTYTLTVDYTVNDVSQPRESTTRTCP